MSKEQKFYKALQDVFIGAKIEGEGGFVNLMRIKSNYYRKIEDILKKDIESALKNYPSFRDELFDKLYSFFSRYFTESGSIYFNSTPFHNNIYEKVYTDEKDVILFWKTQMLYYVKTDKIFRSLPVEFDGFKFYFDASKIENKKANEKRSLVFELNKIHEDGTIVFDVQYSERGRKTKQEDILKAIKRKGIAITEEQLERSFRVFEKQSEVDFFINKNAKAFLQEQFKLWSYQYFWEGAKKWSTDRVNQLQILKDIAFKLIDFISQFEDELVKIWNKPKFVKNSNYVITLDRINKIELIEKILKHENMNEQIEEWQELGIVDENFKTSDVFTTDLIGKHLFEKYQHLPIDTKHFKDLELEILSQFEDLDKSLDGWLIKSENYQALNTILPKFKEKVQTIYIDPPFNTGDDFDYVDRYQDSSWLSLIENRIVLSKYFLNAHGSFFVNLDENADFFGRILLEELHFEEIKKITFDTNATKDEEADLFGYKSFGNNFALKSSTIYFCKNKNSKFYKLWKPNRNLTNLNIGWLDLIAFPKKDRSKFNKIEDFDYFIEKYDTNGHLEYLKIDINEKIYPVGDIWNDIYSFTQSEMRTSENLSFQTQKPENFLRRIIQASSTQKEIILDFFGGSGTTYVVAHKLNRKWIGIEMGEYFYEFYEEWDKTQNKFIKKLGILGRLKNVLAGDKEFKAVTKNRRSHLSKDINWQGGGFFKYYELEQYEETLANCKYKDGDLFQVPGRSSYQEYVFMKDEKMLEALEIDYENNKVKVDLDKLYPNIDIAETLSNLTGKGIKKINDDEVEFEDGMKINTKDLDYKLIKPLIWWD
ncbi:DNA methylase [Petrotoga sp. 9PW.55.5.1]|uniref:DNA methyltransferase n=1 Tax=Petrotoga sp. 9PW.55.5.1 TaxID=1308979 RepID=UPI000DC5EB8A|nr:site-specific DNA-methyltransferase [Petrotoga sp. 9PW.55.5.1]RAO99580.1 DNA methylase [Petrotoga sp. 9PW.55.5.1]